MHRIIRLPEVKRITGLATSTIYKMIVEGTFPKQRQLGCRSVGWLDSEVLSWVNERTTKI